MMACIIDERRVDALIMEIICDDTSIESPENVLDIVNMIVLIDDSIGFHSCSI